MTVLCTFTGPISPEARHQAEQFYRQQATPEKGEQVRLNTLAISFVNFYLECMGFETDLEAGDSWNPVQQTLLDVADLSLKNLGYLECRPVLVNAQFVYVPPEVQANRIGYVAVQINESLREATILGFIKQVSTELLPTSQLQPLENLLEYLEELSQVQPAEFATQLLMPSRTLVNLKQWFENNFQRGWQQISDVLAPQPADEAWNLRDANFVSGGKQLDLGKHMATQSVVLVVAFSPENLQETDIIVEVYPTSEQTYLPPNLQVSVLDFEGVAIMEAQARNANKNIQLQFSVELGERFSVKVTLGEGIAIEDFVI